MEVKKIDFQTLRDSLIVIRRTFDLVGYSSTRCTLGSIYWRCYRVASSSGHPGAASWFRIASAVNYLHLPALGQWAATEAFQGIPQGDREAFRRAYQGGAALD